MSPDGQTYTTKLMPLLSNWRECVSCLCSCREDVSNGAGCVGFGLVSGSCACIYNAVRR